MKLLFAAAAVVAAYPGPAMSQPHLDALRWTSRLLVVVAPEAGDARLDRQRRIFDTARRGADARDLLWIEGAGRTAEADALRRRFGIAPGAFRALLVGKDGGAKLSSAEPIAAERLFSEIDAMPMRRDEIRRGGDAGR